MMYKPYIAMWHIASMLVGLVMSTIQTARILKTGKTIKWTSIVGGFMVMTFSLVLVLWRKKTTLKEIKRLVR